MSQEPAPVENSAERRMAESLDEGATRRGLLFGTGLAAAGALAAACGGGGAQEQPQGGGAAPGENLVQASEVPVGSGKVIKEKGVIVTQPKEGVWRAFENKCTHTGCEIDKVEGKHMVCPCHGSKFTLGDAGPVPGSPAKKPLPQKGQVKVENGWVKLA
jgi:nitrite reductase/ring-hydroxylating ferredoxin subunit